MIPLERLPGHGEWGASLPALCGHPGPLWLHGEAGCGLSTLARWLDDRRHGGLLDDPESMGEAALKEWLRAHPRGVVACHGGPQDPRWGEMASHCLVFRLPSLAEAPGSLSACAEALAEEEGVPLPLPPALLALPCPGNLRGLRNRLIRWKLLGQLPEEAGPGVLPLDTENLAANLHVLERLLLHRALRRSYGNRVEAARRLGVSRRQLYLLIARHGDPVRGEAPRLEGPKRLLRGQNSRGQAFHR